MHAREFEEQGFTVVRGFFSREEAAELLAEIERRSHHEDTHDALTTGGMVFNHNVFLRSEKVQKFVSSSG